MKRHKATRLNAGHRDLPGANAKNNGFRVATRYVTINPRALCGDEPAGAGTESVVQSARTRSKRTEAGSSF